MDAYAYGTGGGFAQPFVDSFEDALDHAQGGNTRGAALSVAVMVAGAAIFLAVLKKSGFRAMVAVGRG